MFKTFFWSRGWALYAYLGVLGLIALVLAQVGVATVFNAWNGFFYDTLQHATTRPLSDLWWGVILFAGIGAADMILGTALSILNPFFTLWWRTATTKTYTERWRHCYQQIEGASQRIQEDPQQLPETVTSLGLTFFRAVITLWAFIPILNRLNVPMAAGFFGWNVSLVEIALFCSLCGTAILVLVGWKQSGANYHLTAIEAAFRKRLALAEEHRPLLDANGGWRLLYEEVRRSRHHLYLLVGYNVCWGTTYDKVVMVLPYILCIPYLHDGVVTFGFALMTVNAFGQVQGAFATGMQNFPAIARLWSVVRRMREFQRMLDAPMQSRVAPNVITLPRSGEPASETPDESVFRELSVKSRLY